MNSPSALQPHRLRWIAFDAVGTVIYPHPPVSTLYHRVGQKHGSRLSPFEVKERFTAAFSQAEQRDALLPEPYSCNEAGEWERWRVIVSEVLIDVYTPEECFQELYADFALPQNWRCFADVQPTLEALKQAGFRLLIASNFDQRLHPLCDGLEALRFLDLRAVSSEMGWKKPGLRFYQSMLELAGCQADEMLMVGDDDVNDIQAARAAGLPVVKISRQVSPQSSLEISTLTELLPLLNVH